MDHRFAAALLVTSALASGCEHDGVPSVLVISDGGADLATNVGVDLATNVGVDLATNGAVDLATEVVITPGPCTGVDAPPPHLPSARFLLAAAAGGDGRIYVVGGSTAFGGVANSTAIDIFDPRTDTFTPGPPMPAPAGISVAAASTARRLYVLSGKQLHALEFGGKAWKPMKPRALGLEVLALVATTDGRLYAVGGEDQFARFGVKGEVYDERTDTWAALPDMPFVLDGFAAVPGADGRIYAVGVVVGSYDPAMARWARLPDQPTPRYWEAAATDGAGRIYTMGGLLPGQIGVRSHVERYDPANQTWSKLANLPVATMESAAALGCDGRIYNFGGDASGMVSDLVQRYDVKTDRWTLSN